MPDLKRLAHDGPLPIAWMGYDPKFTDRLTVRVCAWCPDKAAADALAEAEGLKVSHGVCPACYQQQLTQRYP